MPPDGSYSDLHLSQHDTKFTASGVVLWVKWSKTRQHKQGIHIIPLPSIPDSPLCPVSPVHRNFTLVPAPPDAPFFSCLPTVHGFGLTPLTSRYLTIALRLHSGSLGLNTVNYQIHIVFGGRGGGGGLLMPTKLVVRIFSLSCMRIGAPRPIKRINVSPCLHAHKLLMLWLLVFLLRTLSTTMSNTASVVQYSDVSTTILSLRFPMVLFHNFIFFTQVSLLLSCLVQFLSIFLGRKNSFFIIKFCLQPKHASNVSFANSRNQLSYNSRV